MKDSININIVIQNPSISEFHSTISSIIMQNNYERLKLYIHIINETNLDISSELNRIKKTNINISSNKTKTRFTINLVSGEIISKSFLYKATYYLKHNDSAFVCPEYTIRRIDNSPIMATIRNNNLLSNSVSGKLVDNQKNCFAYHYTPRATIIPNCCIVLPTIDVDFQNFCQTISFQQSFFTEDIYNPKNIAQTSKAKKSSSNKHRFMPQKNLDNWSLIYINDQTKNELSLLSNINPSLNGCYNMNYYDITAIQSQYSEKLYSCYQMVAQHLSHNHYEYIMVAPWIIPGGIDLFSINYLKSIAKINKNHQILVILTDNFYKSLNPEKLNFPKNIELINLPEIIKDELTYKEYSVDLLYSLINILNPKRLHIIASKVGYDCVIKYNEKIHKKTALLFSSYNFLIGKNGEYLGYHVQELPRAYKPGDITTTDNQKAKNFLIEKYGFLEKDILIHRQLIEPTNTSAQKSNSEKINILWAAHVRPEKNPEIIPIIAKKLENDNINITCYGIFDPNCWNNGKNPLKTHLNNLNYVGPYNNFFKDIVPSKYDLFLYTSHTDGMPNVILEAAIAGLPIISSEVGGIHDVVGDQAVLIQDTNSAEDFVNAIRDFISHTKKYRNNAASLKIKLIKQYNEANFINQVKDMLNRSDKNA